MDTSKMQCLEKMDSGKSYELLEIVQDFVKVSSQLKLTLESTFLREQMIEIVENYYELGIVKEVYEIFGGYINRSFGAVLEKDGIKKDYFIRKYKMGITNKEVLFEHALINHAGSNGLTIGAGLIRNKQGGTYVHPSNSRSIFAIYEFLEGEDKYTWDNPIMNNKEYASAAEVLATFHNAARNFDPKGLERAEPKILDMVPTLPETFRKYAKEDRNTKFHCYYLDNLDNIVDVIEKNRITGKAEQMPLNPIHCDYHPGNLKFLDNKVVGVFDFDWSKIDLRLFDVCLAMVYSCSCWDEKRDGTMLLDKVEIFLQSYQKTLENLNGLKPLNHAEIENLPVMVAMANFYLLNWDITAYYAEEDMETLNDYEYLAYLKHNVRLMEWIEVHKEEISQIIQSLQH